MLQSCTPAIHILPASTQFTQTVLHDKYMYTARTLSWTISSYNLDGAVDLYRLNLLGELLQLQSSTKLFMSCIHFFSMQINLQPLLNFNMAIIAMTPALYLSYHNYILQPHPQAIPTFSGCNTEKCGNGLGTRLNII